MSIKKDMAQLMEQVADTLGWAVGLSGRQHYRVMPPEGSPIFVSKTPSSHATLKNTEARLRRAGWRRS